MIRWIAEGWRAAVMPPFLRPGKLAEGVLMTFFWQCMRILLQLAWVVGAARLMGVKDFGLLAGAAGLAAGIAGFVGLGTGLLLFQEAARDHGRFGTLWRQALAASWLSGPCLALLYVPAAIWLLGIDSAALVIGVAVAELVFQPMLALVAFAFASCNRLGWSAAVPVMGALARVLALGAFSLADPGARDLAAYAWLHASMVAMSVVLALAAVARNLRPGPAADRLSWTTLRASAVFAISWATSASITSLDKAVVLRAGGEDVSGQYSSAYRFVVLLALPVEALTMAAMPRLFRQQGTDVRHERLVLLLAALAGGYGMLAGAFAWFAADWLAVLLGAEFAAAAVAARWLAILVPLYSLRVLGLHILLASGRANEKVGIELASLVVMLVAGVLLVTPWGLSGAVVMIIASEAWLAALSWWRVGIGVRRQDAQAG